MSTPPSISSTEGRKSCQKGNAFHIQLGLPLGNPRTNVEPLCITGKLAVDLTALMTKEGTLNDSQNIENARI
jgi:hypothetical protein